MERDNLNSGSQNLIVDEIAALSARGFEFATTAGFADYRERMCALNNSLSAKLRSHEDTLTANYESAMTRAGLEQAFQLKVMQHRLKSGATGLVQRGHG